MRHRDFIQNIAITLLAVSALFLFSRTQFFQLGAASVGNYWQRITAPASSATDDVILSDTLSAPVRAAVTGEYGRYASVTLTTGEDRFIPIKTLLREVLGSARNRTDSTQAAFLEALGKTSVYCDFLSSLPAAYLADLMGLSTDSSLSIRALAAVEEKGQVILLLWDGGSHYYQCATAVQTSTLTEVLDHFELGVSTFAFEDSSGYGQRLSPLSLFPDPLPELPQLTLSAASVPTETLLSALGFNPHTNSRYQDASGAEVVVEGDRVIRISASGAFSYTSGRRSRAVHRRIRDGADCPGSCDRRSVPAGCTDAGGGSPAVPAVPDAERQRSDPDLRLSAGRGPHPLCRRLSRRRGHAFRPGRFFPGPDPPAVYIRGRRRPAAAAAGYGHCRKGRRSRAFHRLCRYRNLSHLRRLAGGLTNPRKGVETLWNATG